MVSAVSTSFSIGNIGLSKDRGIFMPANLLIFNFIVSSGGRFRNRRFQVLLITDDISRYTEKRILFEDDDTVKYSDEKAQVHMRILDEEQQYPSNIKIPLKVKKLNKSIGGLHVLRDLTFDVGPSECFGLLGSFFFQLSFLFMQRVQKLVKMKSAAT